MVYIEDGCWAQRGCTIDQKIFDSTEDGEDVLLCSESGCNNENVLHSQCVTCTSDLQGECADITNKDGFLQQCEGIYPYEKRGCYTLVKG